MSPQSKESWLINSATVFEGAADSTLIVKHGLPQGASIVLQEDGAERVYHEITKRK